MVAVTSLVPVCLLLVCSALGQEATWRSSQAAHRPVRLENFRALAPVALLDETLDPDGSIFRSLLQPILRSRYVGTQAHEDVRQHIVSTMASLGWSVDGDRAFSMRTPVGDKTFTNVIATHDPTAPRRLVLACHYESIYNRPNFVAATDSAVPCTMMLYLAELMTRAYLDPMKGRSEVTLQLMFLDGEEAFVRWTDSDSIYGARHLANEMQNTFYQRSGNRNLNDLHRIDMFVLLDLLGAANPTISNLIADTNSEFRHLVAVERKLKKNNMLENIPNIFRYTRNWGFFGAPQVSDDHIPFMRRGVPILHVIPSPFPSVWHTNRDNGNVIHFPTVKNLNRILRVFVAEYLRIPTFA